MKLLAVIIALPSLACAPAQAQTVPAPREAARGDDGAMEVSRSAARPSARGPADWFTGIVSITPLFDSKGPSRVGAALVRFEPGARTAWHKHPLGQRLIVLEGSGWTQVEGGPVEAIRAGDVVWCPPGVRHWHGATPKTSMAHIATQEAENGSPVTWMEHVSDKQYRGGLDR